MLAGLIAWSYVLNLTHYLDNGASWEFAAPLAAMLPLCIAAFGGSLPGLTGENARREAKAKKIEEAATQLKQEEHEKEARAAGWKEKLEALQTQLSTLTGQAAQWQEYATKLEQERVSWQTERNQLTADITRLRELMLERASVSESGAADSGGTEQEMRKAVALGVSDNHARAQEMRNSGLSFRAIGAELGVNESTVRGWLRDA
jgi:hypothetical protein